MCIRDRYQKANEESGECFTYREEELKMKRALGPTNVLWENFEFTKKQRRCRISCALISMILGGLAYFLIATYALEFSQLITYL